MDGFIAVLMVLLGGALTYLFGARENHRMASRNKILELELQRESQRRISDRNKIRMETTKVAFNEAKKQFLERYSEYLPTDGDDSSSSK